MAKKAAAQNGRADLPVSQDAQQRVCDWHASHYVKVMLYQIFGENNFQNEYENQPRTACGFTQTR
jgi:hypothetical protein